MPQRLVRDRARISGVTQNRRPPRRRKRSSNGSTPVIGPLQVPGVFALHRKENNGIVRPAVSKRLGLRNESICNLLIRLVAGGGFEPPTFGL